MLRCMGRVCYGWVLVHTKAFNPIHPIAPI